MSASKVMVVGGLACQRNSFLFKGFKTSIISCEEVEGKSKKDEVSYKVELKDTILFPEGGGQPSDSGVFKLVDGTVIPVHRVAREGLHAKHFISQRVDVGAEVNIEVDAKKRIDYMQQHTGQHLLSALLESEYSLNTLSWSMGGIPSAKKQTLEPADYFNYIELERKLTNEEIDEISEKINELISINPHPITVIERALGDDSVNTTKIPDDYDLEKGILRTIEIEELDSNPCCGTHLQNTSQIGSVLITKNQTTVRGSNSRLYFMCGSRVYRYGASASDILAKTKILLSCSEVEIPDKVSKSKNTIQLTNKREQFWIKELATIEAERLALKFNESRKCHLIKDEFGSLDFLLQVYKELTEKCHLQTTTEPYEIIICGREKQTNTGSLLIVSNSGDRIAELSTEITGSILNNCRGGGGKKGGKWQGKIMKFTDLEYDALTHYLCQ